MALHSNRMLPDEKVVVIHISAVERAALRELREGQRVTFEVVADRKTGKSPQRQSDRLSVIADAATPAVDAHHKGYLWDGLGRSRPRGVVSN